MIISIIIITTTATSGRDGCWSSGLMTPTLESFLSSGTSLVSLLIVMMVLITTTTNTTSSVLSSSSTTTATATTSIITVIDDDGDGMKKKKNKNKNAGNDDEDDDDGDVDDDISNSNNINNISNDTIVGVIVVIIIFMTLFVVVGSLPDMLSISADCSTAVVAVENEAFVQGGQFYDPPGGVGIIRFPSGIDHEPETKILNFTKFDDR